MRPLWYGGSFNPIHHGHLICARAIAESVGYDQVILLPSAHPPHKPANPELAPAEDRLAMCRLAASLQPHLFQVHDLELRRTGHSYTIDTVRILKQQGHPTVDWLIGADMLRLLPHWYQPEALLREVNFVIIARPGWSFDWATLPPSFRALEKNVHPAPAIDISATDIRRRIATGRSIDFLTPPNVIDYIRTHRLYQHPPHSALC